MKELIDTIKLPRHIAIIMDGNGRWAKKNGKNRHQGHQEGVISVREIVEISGKIGIKYLTIYTFSTENWNRPIEEISALMTLITTTVQHETDNLMKNNIRLQIIGDVERLPKITRDNLNNCIEKTAKNNGLTLILAISYSSRWEITEAVKNIAYKVKNGQLAPEDINEKIFSTYLSTNNIPSPDLLIRTGGEYRLSNYLLWQLAYTELYFTPIYWPEFRKEDFYKAIRNFQKRGRRFGQTGEQMKKKNKY